MTAPKNKILTQTQIDEGRSLLHDFKNVLDGDFEKCAKNIAQALATAREEGRRETNDEFEKAKAVITEANNSLYGSQGYFLGMGGGFDKYHLARPIEKLKETARNLPPMHQKVRANE